MLPSSGFALDPTHDILQFNCQTWNRTSGLPANGINYIEQTTDGSLWLGTSAGLVHFDGLEFKLLDLGLLPEAQSSSVVNSLCRSKYGGLWVGLKNSSFGLCDGQSFSFKSKKVWEKVDPRFQYVHHVCETRDGTLWIGADGGLMSMTHSGVFTEVFGHGDNALNKSDSVSVLHIFEDQDGRLFFGTQNGHVFCLQAGKLTKIQDADLEGKPVFALTVDGQGQVWVGSSYGLSCYDKDFARKEIPGMNYEVRALLTDRQGVVWIGTSGSGLGRYQSGGYSFIRKVDGLAGDYVRSLVEDREGSLWVGTRDGLSQLTDVKFTTHSAAENPIIKDALSVASSRKGGIWIGSSVGLTYLDTDLKTYGVESGLTNPYTKRVYEARDGDVYLVSGVDKLLVFSGGKIAAAYQASSMVVGMTEDAHGVVVSVGGTLYRAGRNSFAPYAFSNGPPDMEWILNLASGRNGEIWGACNHGIFRVKDGLFTKWGAAEGLPDPTMQWVCQDDEGVVWGASLNGAVRLKNNKITFYTRKNGLLDNNVYSIVPDNLGNLWMDSGCGIFEVSRKSMNDFADGKTNRIECTGYDGPESVRPSDKTTQEHVACKSIDGRIWFPSANGVVEIDPANVPRNRVAPPVVIESVRANGVEMSRTNSMVVPPGYGELEIHFAAMSFIAPHNVRIRYMLEGCDKDWVEVEDRRMAFYANLKPGKYKFHVMAANADGVWNAGGDTIAIELRPHYYQTGWFSALCGGLACAAILGGFYARMDQLRRKQEEMQRTRELLEAEVQSRTAELAQANGSLQKEIAGHEETEARLKENTIALEGEIEERKRMQKEVESAHVELLEVSRLAGMSEIATNVLHNVGNVLNSVNVSATLARETVKKSKAVELEKICALLREHENDLAKFFTEDPKGKIVTGYLEKLSKHIQANQTAAIGELDLLQKNVEHINQIVAMQQNYARMSGVKEILNVQSLVEDCLRMNLGSMERHGIKVVREFQDIPPVNVEKHKILQIVINLLRNAKHACDDSGKQDKQLTVRVANGNGRIKISVADNGVGIPPENLNRIFNHGFTTRSTGHGFGLHSGALAAKEMGGALNVHSDGPGKGATFTLELPVSN
jgi:ligand-binding sensor domain-containing protein/signal transduction histidine kinase